MITNLEVDSIAGIANLTTQLFLLVVVALYTIFAFLVSKQVGILNKTIQTPSAWIIDLGASFHLVLSIGLVLAIILALILR